MVGFDFFYAHNSLLLSNKFKITGGDMGKLTVSIKYGNKSSILWRFGDNIGDVWNAAQATVPQISDYPEFSFVFEGLDLLNLKNLNHNFR
jgi:hypothetical protein